MTIIEFYLTPEVTQIDREDELRKTLAEFCQIDPKREVEVKPSQDMLGRPSPSTDKVNQIPPRAIIRYLPKTVEYPYNLIDRGFFLHPNGFLVATYRPEIIRFNRELDIYEQVKYQIIYNTLANLDEFSEEVLEEVVTVWIEVLCVNPKFRKQGVGLQLVQALEESVQERFQKARRIILALDTPGTKGGHINYELYRYYSNPRLGFTFVPMEAGANSGNQFAYKIIKDEQQKQQKQQSKQEPESKSLAS